MSTVKTGEILFVKCVKDGIPNRDPLCESDARRVFGPDDNRMSLSDVSTKRDVRDQFLNWFPDGGHDKTRHVFVQKKFNEEGTVLLGRGGLADAILKKTQKNNKQKEMDIEKELLDATLDNRIFGLVHSVKGQSFHRTGPVQFGWGHSLHPVETRYVQGTVCIPSSDEKVTEKGEKEGGKTQGTIWTQYYLPFAVFAMPGVINAPLARDSRMKVDDMELLLESLWKGTLGRQARGRGFQLPLFLLHVEYIDESFRIGYLEDGIRLEPGCDASGREKWLGGTPPTSLGEVKLDVRQLAHLLRSYESFIAKARLWIDPRLQLIGELPANHCAFQHQGKGAA